MKRKLKKILIIGIISFIVMLFIYTQKNFKQTEIIKDYSEFVSEINTGKIKKVYISKNILNVVKKDTSLYKTYIPINDQRLLNTLLKNKIEVVGIFKEKSNLIISTVISWMPIFLLLIFWFFFVRKVFNTGKKSIFFGKNRFKILTEKKNKTTFSDIAGCDDVKLEIMELVEFLKEPKKFEKLGGKIPKSILMIGPPGTGKTLLAKAIAGEANIPFLNISGSEFVEMFVGVGAARVRNIFQQAKKISPCIIFIDEIDAIGKHRSVGLGSGHDEREQTLNQMLVEMDGFEGNKGIIVIAATNRPDVLDPALLRPGRFDRNVIINLPDIKGRKQILKVHIKKIPLSADVNISIIARGIPGFSGADIANLVNESAILAARKNKNKVSMKDFEQAKDKMLMGVEKKSLIMTKKQKESIAYHESGHAIIGRIVPGHDPIHKVSIIPRLKSLGVTIFLPTEDFVSISKEKLESQISTLYGGRIAEEIIYGSSKISTGSSHDIKIATLIAKNMIMKWGFSKKLGPLQYLEEDKFLGKSFMKTKNISNETSFLIDQEIRLLINKNYRRGKKILRQNIDILHSMKDALMKFETIDSSQIDNLMNRLPI